MSSNFKGGQKAPAPAPKRKSRQPVGEGEGGGAQKMPKLPPSGKRFDYPVHVSNGKVTGFGVFSKQPVYRTMGQYGPLPTPILVGEKVTLTPSPRISVKTEPGGDGREVLDAELEVVHAQEQQRTEARQAELMARYEETKRKAEEKHRRTKSGAELLPFLRMRLARDKHLGYFAARTIQCCFRMKVARAKVVQRKYDKQRERDEDEAKAHSAATKIECCFRMHKARKARADQRRYFAGRTIARNWLMKVARDKLAEKKAEKARKAAKAARKAEKAEAGPTLSKGDGRFARAGAARRDDSQAKGGSKRVRDSSPEGGARKPKKASDRLSVSTAKSVKGAFERMMAQAKRARAALKKGQ
jgi:hypothetical protein